MKASISPFFFFAGFSSLLDLQAEDTPQEILLRTELEAVSLDCHGIGEKHPSRLKVEGKIEVLETQPDIRNSAYYDLVRKTVSQLEKEKSKLETLGFGSNHPSVLAVAAQLKELARRGENQTEDVDDVDAVRVKKGMTYHLSVAAIPAKEAKRWDDDYAISDEGEILLPLIGNVRIGGLKLREAEKAIEKELKAKNILKFPVVILRSHTGVEQDKER